MPVSCVRLDYTSARTWIEGSTAEGFREGGGQRNIEGEFDKRLSKTLSGGRQVPRGVPAWLTPLALSRCTPLGAVVVAAIRFRLPRLGPLQAIAQPA